MNKSLFKRATAIAAASALALSATLIAPLFSSADDINEDDVIYSTSADSSNCIFTIGGSATTATNKKDGTTADWFSMGTEDHVLGVYGSGASTYYCYYYLGASATKALAHTCTGSTGCEEANTDVHNATDGVQFAGQVASINFTVNGFKSTGDPSEQDEIEVTASTSATRNGRKATATFSAIFLQNEEITVTPGDDRQVRINNTGASDVAFVTGGGDPYVNNEWSDAPLKITTAYGTTHQNITISFRNTPSDTPPPPPSDDNGSSGGGGGGGSQSEAVRDQIISGGGIGGGGGGTNNTESGGGGREVKVIADSAEAKTTVSNTTRGTVTL
ncbi:MAG: hypothetical protein FWG90_06960, partial [Oscillospiraceae bacterium]|nr:hypothetical protein [Oscillospiraceae bacterium]MCL2054161.1 hypothetical protein [Oscillospiraceae bacterium]